MKPDGSDERLLSASFLDEGPTWAPNGRVLMFFRDPGGSSGPALFTIDVTGRNEQRIPSSLSQKGHLLLDNYLRSDYKIDCRGTILDLGRRTHIMGILNVTPDSFSDGGRYADAGPAFAHAREMAAAGADIIDIGGESTRPGAAPLSEDEELRRIIQLIERLAQLLDARGEGLVPGSGPAPDAIEQLLLGHDVGGALDQQCKDVCGARGELYLVLLPP